MRSDGGKVGYLHHMSLQTTTLLFILLVLAGGCAASSTVDKSTSTSTTRSRTVDTPSPDGVDPVLLSVGLPNRSARLEGTLSSSGAQAMSGAQFEAVVDTNNDVLLKMGGPFGITAARMVLQRDRFVMVNYLLQEVWEGNPNSPLLKTAMHLPVSAPEMMNLMRGCVPGDPARFSEREAREDGKVLYAAKSERRVEFLLIDLEAQVIQQYQVKNAEGELELDVAFQNLKEVDGILVPHKVILAADNRQQTATVEIEEITLDIDVDRPLRIDVPSSYSRKSFK